MAYKVDKKKIIYADLDPTEGLLLNLDTKFYYRLNETAQMIWQDLSAGRTETEIVDHIMSEFSVNRDEALDDVKALVNQMKDEQLLTTESHESQPISVEAARASKKEHPTR